MDRLRQRSSHREQGFTLIEVMVALGILAAGLLTVAAAQLYAMRGGASGRHASDAATFAHSRLEAFQRIDFTDPLLADTGGAWVSPAPADEPRVQVETDGTLYTEMSYRIQWRIADVDPELKRVDVRVLWNEPQRPNRSLVLSTMVHNDPPTGG